MAFGKRIQRTVLRYFFEIFARIALVTAVACVAVWVPAGAADAATVSGEGRAIYVSATKGDDANTGSPELPLRTISAAVQRVGPGDAIVVMPGTYRPATSDRSYGHGIEIDRDGEPWAPIILTSAEGGVTIDCSDMKAAKLVYCLNIAADYWVVSNIAVTGALQNSNRAWAVGINLESASYNILRSVESYGNQGPGILIAGNSKENRIEDCVAHSNYDPESAKPGGDADGIAIAAIPSSATGNVIRYCRAYSNSDDGIDLWRAEAIVTIEHTVSSENGYVPGTSQPSGDGTGFKLGRNRTGPAHEVRNNLATGNRGCGFARNGGAGPAHYVGNVATGNLEGGFCE